jgi:ribosomal protein S13
MLAKLKVVRVLESLPGIGKVNAVRLMRALGISDSRRLGGVGQNQRERLLRAAEDAEYRRELLNEQRRRDEEARDR